jgi:hypothetical protein
MFEVVSKIDVVIIRCRDHRVLSDCSGRLYRLREQAIISNAIIFLRSR